MAGKFYRLLIYKMLNTLYSMILDILMMSSLHQMNHWK
jgi:hypothetical protein